jgi:chromosome partitioning protein
MKVLAVVSQKGGAGKTTLAMLLADALHQKGYRVLVVDTDPQTSAQKWEGRSLEAYSPFPVRVEAISGLAYREFARWLEKRTDGLDYLIIDTPPNLTSKELRAALAICDLALVPMCPHAAFVDALQELHVLVDEVAAERAEDLPARLVVNKFHPARARASERSIVQHLPQISAWPALKTTLRDAALYADAYNYRTSIQALPGASAAKQAIADLAQEVVQLLPALHPPARPRQ